MAPKQENEQMGLETGAETAKKRGRPPGPTEDLTGTVIGSLTVVGVEHGYRGKGGQAYYRTRCTCGTEEVRHRYTLRKARDERMASACQSCGAALRSGDLVGAVFGRLTVVGRAPSREGSTAAYWVCRCECGREVTRQATGLRGGEYGGDAASCGKCNRKKPASPGRKPVDLTGRVFGRMTVIRRAEKPADRAQDGVYWLCVCECGREEVRAGNNLSDSASKGRDTSCEVCVPKLRADKKTIDLTGQTFGKLTAVEPATPPEGKTGRWWLFRCECGADVVREGQNVTTSARDGKTPACRKCIADVRRHERPETALKRAGETVYGDFIVYCHTHIATQKRYIGITNRSFDVRWREHVSRARQPRTAFHKAIHDFGPEAFTGEILERLGTLAEAQEAEVWWIAHFGTEDRALGYNATGGGDGHVTAADTKEKLREAGKRQKANQTPEQRREIARKGEAQRRATMAARTPEEKAESAARTSSGAKRWWASLTQEQKDAHIAKLLAGRRKSAA
jgi:general stress protein YciG